MATHTRQAHSPSGTNVQLAQLTRVQALLGDAGHGTGSMRSPVNTTGLAVVVLMPRGSVLSRPLLLRFCMAYLSTEQEHKRAE